MRLFLAGSVAFALMTTGSAAYAQADNHAKMQDHAPAGGEHRPPSGDEHRAPLQGAVHAVPQGGAGGGDHLSAHARPPQQSAGAADEHRPSVGANGGQHQGFDPHGHDIQASRQFHDGNYQRPDGYQERRWDHGDRLPPQYYGQQYWIGDYASLGLFEPPPNLIWIRVGDDALLIDRDSGEVVQVDRDVFY